MRTVIGAPVEFPKGADEGEINEVLGRVLGDLVSPDLAQLHYQSAVLFELAAEEG
jgi:hypothetical protein